MTCQEIGVKEKSLSLNRLFAPNQNRKKKMKSVEKGSKDPNCQILENKKTIDANKETTNIYSDEENNNQTKIKQLVVDQIRPAEATISVVEKEENTIELNTRTCVRTKSSDASTTSTSSTSKEHSSENERRTIFAIIFEAIQYKDVTILHRIIKEYPNLDINELNEDGIAVIHFAAMVGSATTIEPLLKYGANIDLKDVRGNPPLHYAYNMRKFEFVSTALQLGANINLLNKKDISKLEKILGKNWEGS